MSTLTTAAYLVSSVLFILSLRGLSHPSSARRGNFLGILGMTIAIVTTLSNPGVLSYKEIGIAFLIRWFDWNFHCSENSNDCITAISCCFP